MCAASGSSGSLEGDGVRRSGRSCVRGHRHSQAHVHRARRCSPLRLGATRPPRLVVQRHKVCIAGYRYGHRIKHLQYCHNPADVNQEYNIA